MSCRSTYDSKPPFRVYIDLEDDPSSAQKVLFHRLTLWIEWHLQAAWGTRHFTIQSVKIYAPCAGNLVDKGQGRVCLRQISLEPRGVQPVACGTLRHLTLQCLFLQTRGHSRG